MKSIKSDPDLIEMFKIDWKRLKIDQKLSNLIKKVHKYGLFWLISIFFDLLIDFIELLINI